MDNTQRGQADHRAVEVYERCASRCAARGVPITPAVERLITAAVIEDASTRIDLTLTDLKGTAMPNVNEMYPDEWLKARHLTDGDQTLTITKDGETTFKDQKTGKDVHQIVPYFAETDLKLGLNKGNAATLAEVLDSGFSEDWIGKKVVIECATSNAGVDYVQVRKHPTKAANRARPAQAKASISQKIQPMTQAEVDDEGDDIPF